MEDLLKKFADRGIFSACCVGFLDTNGTKTWSAGNANAQSLFDLASLTKVWPTAALTQLGFHEGWLDPEKSLSFYLPETVNASAGKHTLRELQNFLIEWKITLSEQKHLDAEALMHKLLQTPTLPSNSPIFSNATSIFLGLVLEKASGKRLDILAKERLFAPLSLKRTGFFPKDIDESAIIPSEVDAWRGHELRGEVHDESAWILQRDGRIPGSAGLFSCVDELLVLAQWQLNNSHSHGEGWERNASWMGEKLSKSAYGKTGFTGTSVVIDPEKNRAVIILCNATYPHRPSNRQPLEELRISINNKLLA
jgi:CubicO group peptidase (beta-lactamase class C family)